MFLTYLLIDVGVPKSLLIKLIPTSESPALFRDSDVQLNMTGYFYREDSAVLNPRQSLRCFSGTL